MRGVASTGGGAGKRTLAFALARWATATSKDMMLFDRPTFAVVVESDPVRPLRDFVVETVVRVLRKTEDDEAARKDIAVALLTRSRVMVILDGVSEWTVQSQHQAQEFHRTFPDVAVIETTRRPRDDAATVGRSLGSARR